MFCASAAGVVFVLALAACSGTGTPTTATTKDNTLPQTSNPDGGVFEEPWMPRSTKHLPLGSEDASGSGAPAGEPSSGPADVVSDADADAGASPAPDDQATASDAGGAGAAAHDASVDTTATVPPTDAASLEPSENCSREFLQEHLDDYFSAMSSGMLDALPLHPAVYYTEDGQPETLGLGLWWSQPTLVFERSALDTERCGSVTEAVLETKQGEPIALGLRLRYVDKQIVDVEAEIARRGFRAFAPENIPVFGMPDPWVTVIPTDKRSSRESLVDVVESFFLSISEPSLSPPRAPTCELRQNGLNVGGEACATGDKAERFEQLRYPVVDETTGLVSAVGIGRGFIAMFLFKIDEGTLTNIDFVGGASAESTGW